MAALSRADSSEDFAALLSKFEVALARVFNGTSQGFEQLLMEFNTSFQCARDQRRGSTPHLKLLSIFGMKSRELCHSRAVAWFLNPNAEHEQGLLFLNALLRKFGLPEASGRGENVVVQLERPERTDISVHESGKFAIFFENKVFHHERKDQFVDMIKALNYFAEKQFIPIPARAAVFLTDDGRPPTTGPEEALPGLLARNIRRLTLFRGFAEALRSEPVKSPLLVALIDAYLDEIESLT